LVYAIRKVQENQVDLKCYWIYRPLASADAVNLQEDNGDTIKENIETLIDANKEAGIEINLEKPECMLVPRHEI
jgi:hypothetical protein